MEVVPRRLGCFNIQIGICHFRESILEGTPGAGRPRWGAVPMWKPRPPLVAEAWLLP